MFCVVVVVVKMKMTLGADKSVIITGAWNPTLPFSTLLNEETPKCMYVCIHLYTYILVLLRYSDIVTCSYIVLYMT